jgi:hypothetical protein
MLVDTNNLCSTLQKENFKTILEGIEEVSINYIPFDDQINNLWIMGDFTDWEPKQMKRGDDKFYFNIILVKGFKYYFSFTERNEMIIDYTRQYEINPRNNHVNNFLELKYKNSEEISLFDSKLHKQLLVDAKKKFMIAKMQNDEEVLELEEMKVFSKRYKSLLEKLTNQRDEDRNRIKLFFE